MTGANKDVPSIMNQLRHASAADVYKILSRQWRQEWVSYGLRRDLDVAHEAPPAKIPVVVRELQESDIPTLFHGAPELMTRKERLEIANRLAHLAAQIPRCFVAVDEQEDRPCYVQWLMTSQHNEQIQRFFRRRFPVLNTNEALLENAYTPLRYRGQGIMSAAMSLIAERARDLGCRYVITFVLQDNAASLKGCGRAGFFPYTVRRDSHLLFHLIRRRRFVELGEGNALRGLNL